MDEYAILDDEAANAQQGSGMALPHIAQFQERVLALLQREASLSHPQVETQVWQQIEAALLAEPIDLSQERRREHADAN